MADAAKSDEIEDVLSSIRRLVSEHQPPERAPTTAPRQDAPADPEEAPDESAGPNEKLILTPALRVTDPEDPWVPITPRAAEEGAEEAGQAGASALPQTDGADWAADLLAGPQDAAATDDAEGAPGPDRPTDQRDTGEAFDATAQGALADGDVTPEPDGPGGEAPESEAADTDGDLQDEAAQEDVPLSFIRSTSSVRDYEPEEGDNGFEAADLPAAMRDLAQSRAAQEGPRGGDSATSDRDAGRVRVEIVKAVIADELQGRPDEADAIAQAGEPPDPASEEAAQREPDAPGPDPADDSRDSARDPAGNVTDFLAAAPEETGAALSSGTGVEDLGEEGPFTFPDDGDGFVDEDALREVIAEVVREELQGEMGVRITRNIRKLVRREIRLALAAQDLD